MPVNAIPDGYTALTPYLVCRDAAKAIEFYTGAFGGQEVMRMPGPDGRVMHAEMKIGGSMLMLSDENPERGFLSPASIGGTATSIMFYTDDVDAVFNRALSLGATSEQSPSDMFWGDRMGNLVDPFGHRWAVATHKEDVTPDEMERRMAAASA